MNAARCMTVALLTALAAVAVAQEAELIKQLEAERTSLYAERSKLQKQLAAARDKVVKRADLADLRRAYEEAEAVYREVAQTDPELAAARKTEQEAFAAYRKAVQAAGAADPAVKQLQAELAEAGKAEVEAEKQRRAADSDLRRLRAKIAASEDVRAQAEELTRLDKHARDLRGTDPGLIAGRKAMFEAEQTYRKASQQLPEYKAREVARKAYYKALQEHAGLKAAEADRQRARKALDKRVDELLPGDEAGSALLAKRKAAGQTRDEARKKYNELRRKVYQAISAVAAKDPAVQEALKAQSAVRKASREAYAKATGPTRAARDKARAALDAKAREELANDPEAVHLNKKLQALQERMRDVRDRISRLRKGQGAQPKTD